MVKPEFSTSILKKKFTFTFHILIFSINSILKTNSNKKLEFFI